jgi:hypothetical protein
MIEMNKKTEIITTPFIGTSKEYNPNPRKYETNSHTSGLLKFI